MKKGSMKFYDEKSEEGYQKEWNKQFRMPIFLIGHWAMLVISIVKMIQDISQSQFSGLPAIIGSQVYIIFSLLLIKFRPQYIQLALIIFNYSLLAYEEKLKATVSDQALPLFINSFTICNILLMLVLDVCQSYFLIVTTFLYKLISTIIIDTQNSYNVYIATCTLMGFLCFSSRRLNFQSRHNYLLSQKDNLWGNNTKIYFIEKILPKVVDSSFILFSFNTEKMEFQHVASKQLNFPCNNTEELKIFLRNSKCDSQTLEQYLFKVNKSNYSNEQETYRIQIFHDKVSLSISYVIFYYQQPIILIKFEDTKTYLNEQLNSPSSIDKFVSQQCKIFQFFYKHLSKHLGKKDLESIILLRNICYKQILNYKIRKQKNLKPANENINSLIYPISRMFFYKNVDVIFPQEKMRTILTLRNHFKRLLFEIFLQCRKNEPILFKISESALLISYRGKQINSQSFGTLSFVLNSLVKLQLKNDENQIVLQLLIEPHIPFQ